MVSRFRIIPALQIDKDRLVKTKCFSEPNYLGDPINAARIFSNWVADEIIIIDISARKLGSKPDFNLLEKIAKYVEIPISYGGGISTVNDALKIIDIGYERVILQDMLLSDPKSVEMISKIIGQQSIVASIDYSFKVEINNYNNKKFLDTYTKIINHIKMCIELGVGEIILTCINRDGLKSGLDLDFAAQIGTLFDIPIVISGGTSSFEDIKKASIIQGISGVAVGTLFSYLNNEDSVLLSYKNLW